MELQNGSGGPERILVVGPMGGEDRGKLEHEAARNKVMESFREAVVLVPHDIAGPDEALASRHLIAITAIWPDAVVVLPGWGLERLPSVVHDAAVACGIPVLKLIEIGEA